MRQQKSARELEKEASKTYDIRALWQQSKDLGMSSSANSQVGLEQQTESMPINPVSSVCPISKIPRGSLPPLFKQQTHKNQQVETLKDLTRLLTLVTKQEKKYEDRLSPHSNFYRRHLMVQQFLQTQLRSQPSQTRRDLSLPVSRAFVRGHHMARNIVQWEKSWVSIREIPEKKEREYGDSWLHDENLNDAIRKFAKT